MAAELKLTVEAVEGSADAAKNTSRIRILLQITTSYGTYNLTGSTAGSLTLNGAQIASLAGKPVQKDTTTTLYSGEHTVQHGPDGTAQAAVEAAFDVETSVRWIYASQTLALPTILRAVLTAGELAIGQAGELHVTDAPSGSEHEVLYTFAQTGGTAVSRTAATTLAWTPPEELAAQIPDSNSGALTLTLVSYSGGQEIGRSSRTVTLTLPQKYQPTAWLDAAFVENDNAQLRSWNLAVRGKSRMAFVCTAVPSLGSRLVKTEFCFGARRVQAVDGRFTLTQVGKFSPQFEVEDSRGRRAGSGTGRITVYDYAAPRILSAEAVRCDSAGQPDDHGTCARAVCTATHSPLDGRNRLTLRCRHRVVGGAWSAWTDLTDGQPLLLSGFDTANSYEVVFQAADLVEGAVECSCIVPTESVSFALAEGGTAAGFGKYPGQAGLDMAWDIHMNGCRITGLPRPQAPEDAAPWGTVNFDRIYPVGSLYLTVSDTDPAQLFGGQWQQLRDVFLLAAGGSYGLGETGGEATHTLTTAELPSHRHSGNAVPVAYNPDGYNAMRSATLTQQGTYLSYTEYAGGGAAHNNMPPYLAVNVWQRTA